MGKQINFYMDDKIKQDFINFLDAEGYVFLPDSSFDILYKLEKENIKLKLKEDLSKYEI